MDCLPDFRSALSSLFESSSPSRISNPGSSASTGPVDLLLLGSGWTGTFLLPLSGEAGLRTAWTTRNGGGGSIPFEFDPNSHQDGGDDDEDDGQLDKFRILPDAKTIVVIFPIYVKGGVVRLLRGYEKSRGAGVEGGKGEGKGLDVEGTRWILLGSTGIWDVSIECCACGLNPGCFGEVGEFRSGSVQGSGPDQALQVRQCVENKQLDRQIVLLRARSL